jgi:hypothetical protein
MKRTMLFFLLTALIAVTAQAQGQYVQALEKGLDLMSESQNAEDMTQAANHFQRIAGAESSEWLPAYYEGYCRIMAAFQTPDGEQAGALLDVAQKAIESATERKGDAAEIGVLQGMLYHARLGADPSQFMTLGPKAGMVLREAAGRDPENPRAAMVLGENLLNTPEAYGGGSENACPLFEKAIRLFEAEQAPATEKPAWGKARAVKNWKQCQGG